MILSPIVQKSITYATRIIQEELTADYVYHDLDHTLSVYQHCNQLAKEEGLNEEEQEVLAIAALFHDLGYLNAYQGHEHFSKIMAADFLKEENYPADKIEQVLACIQATVVEQVPQSRSEEIIKDADLATLGSHHFDIYSAKLRKEWETHCQEFHSDREWYQINLDFLNKHSYFTESARNSFGAMKQINLSNMEDQLKSAT